MNTREKVKYLLFKYINNCRVTLSGEISILTSDIRESILLDDDLYREVTNAAMVAQGSLSHVKFEVKKELQQITIKMFSYNALCVEGNMLESLRFQLQNIIEKVSGEGLTIRANLSGSIKSWHKSDTFMFVYLKGEVAYKITETFTANAISSAFGKLCDRFLAKLRVNVKDFA